MSDISESSTNNRDTFSGNVNPFVNSSITETYGCLSDISTSCRKRNSISNNCINNAETSTAVGKHLRTDNEVDNVSRTCLHNSPYSFRVQPNKNSTVCTMVLGGIPYEVDRLTWFCSGFGFISALLTKTFAFGLFVGAKYQTAILLWRKIRITNNILFRPKRLCNWLI